MSGAAGSERPLFLVSAATLPAAAPLLFELPVATAAPPPLPAAIASAAAVPPVPLLHLQLVLQVDLTVATPGQKEKLFSTNRNRYKS